jgi:hypothetical protein
MTFDDFQALPEHRQKELLVDAEKLDQHLMNNKRLELYRIDDFFVEVITSFEYRYRKIVNCYNWKDIPFFYSATVLNHISRKEKGD